MRNVLDKRCGENQNTHFVFDNFFPRKLCRSLDEVITGISVSKVMICIGNSGSNPERAPCR